MRVPLLLNFRGFRVGSPGSGTSRLHYMSISLFFACILSLEVETFDFLRRFRRSSSRATFSWRKRGAFASRFVLRLRGRSSSRNRRELCGHLCIQLIRETAAPIETEIYFCAVRITFLSRCHFFFFPHSCSCHHVCLRYFNV